MARSFLTFAALFAIVGYASAYIVGGCHPCKTTPPPKPPCGCEAKKCPDPNEEYKYSTFGDATCDFPKPKSCEPIYACLCKEGYVRHEGKCIKLCDCPKKCPGLYEEYVYADKGEPTCDGSKPPPCLPVKECRCISGFVRHEGVCIRISECPPKCKGEHEVYIFTKYEDETCDGDGARTCEEDYACRCKRGYVRHQGICIRKCDCPSKCPDKEELITTQIGEETCDGRSPGPCKSVTECRCIPGYVRHNGKCIRRCDCPPVCKDVNEIYILAKTGEETCDISEPDPCFPVKECRCRDGFVRHEGKCIKKCDCPPKCNDPFEEYITTSVGEATCDVADPDPCAPVTECRCIPGYVRHEGKCIKKCSCPPKCNDPNEIYILTRFEDETCDGEQPASCTAVKACRCRRGYVRHEGKCIKKCSCPPKCSDKFEEYVLARFGEPTCDDPKPDPCTPVKECRCIPGYVRHEGKCIKPCNCPPKCSDPNEVYVVTKYGDATCDGNGAELPAEVTACRCRQGYVRQEGICIRKCDCPPKCNDPFEEYITTSVGEATCDVADPDPCAPVTECRCIPGYVRHEGKCIKPCSCPPKCSDPNEIYILTKFEDETCDGEQPASCTAVKACRCRRGYVRHEGKCIKKCSCPPKCSDKFEEYVLARFGEPTCDDPKPDPCTPVKECRCIPGYVRHEGKCIKPCNCPPKCSDPNEVYVVTKYGDATCDGNGAELPAEVTACRCRQGYVRQEGICIRKCDCPPKCNDPFEEYITTSVGEATCNVADPDPCAPVTECRCIPGYVRHEGKCIKPCSCPPKCNDPNEIYILTRFEDETCDGKKPASCTAVKACRCRRGFVRHDGKCIKSCDCPPKCNGEFEEYIQAYTDEKTCDNDNPNTCNPVKACRCIDGYVRHNGKCIKECDCPPKCSGNNEIFIKTRYTDATCDEPEGVRCDYVEACRCAKGYVRHQGKCIKPCDCPSKCTNPNEEYVWATTGERTCGEPTPAPCTRVRECRCVSGYVRHNGKCIKPSQCPCGENEVYSDCAPIDQETCKTVGKKCSKRCRPGCMCLPGFVRNCDNKCIKRCDC